jgi:hypothetical protein
MIDLLQISDSLNQVAGHINVDRNNDGSISFMELLFMGGWIMIPLAIMLLIGHLCIYRTLHSHTQCFKY